MEEAIQPGAEEAKQEGPGQFIPPEVEGGGTQVGNSYVKVFDLCPRLWFNSYYRPLLREDGSLIGRGITPHLTTPPLLKGRLLHETMAAWYLSGCRDGEDTGERSIDQALDTLVAHHQKAKTEYETTEEWAADRSSLEVMMRAYHDRFGPSSPYPEWPDILVAFNSRGEPMVETPWALRLSPEYVFTCRTDLLIHHRGYLKVMEHKTCHYRFVWQRKASLGYDAQFTGEISVLRSHFPDTPLNGVLANILVKDRSVKSSFDVAERETTTRTDAQLLRWKDQTLSTLHRIQEAIGKFELAMEMGLPLERAADLHFPTLGTRTDTCRAYNRPCDYYELCQLPGLEERLMGKYRVRTSEEIQGLRERPY